MSFEELNYRRYEYRDALNLPSRKAAERLGFIYEGTSVKLLFARAFQTRIDKIDKDFNKGYACSAEPDNFDENGQQIKSLREC